MSLEKIFNRSLLSCFSKEKVMFVFPVLALCGGLAVICRMLALGASEWVALSLAFLPIFLCGGLLLAVGIILVRVYHDEVKGKEVFYLKTLKSSTSLFWGISYLAVPLIFTYLILWMGLGIFYLLRAIPVVGQFIGSVLAVGPFLLVLGSFFLGLVTLLTLFYLTPAAALKSQLTPQFTKRVFIRLSRTPFLAFILPLIALLPLALTGGLLTLAAIVTDAMYVGSGGGLSLFFKWLLMMLPSCLALTPSVIFFFQFSAEGYALMRRQKEAQ